MLLFDDSGPSQGERGSSALITTSLASDRRRRLAAWVADHVMPHEGEVRAWLRRRRVSPEDIDDLIQESYCCLASLDALERIERPGAYFFSVARNQLLKRVRQAQVVPLVAIGEIDGLEDEVPSPERQVAGRLAVERVSALIAQLGEPCASVVRMRKLEDRSQREIAAALGITEGMVEWHVHTGVKAILKRLRGEEDHVDAVIGRDDDPSERRA